MHQTRFARTSTHLRSSVPFVVGGVALLLACAAWLPAQAPDGGGRAQSLYTPPPCIGVFTDVPCGGPTPNIFANWIEQLAQDNITLGCATDMYCPEQPVLRQEMAVFLERTMRGTATWPPHTVLVFHHSAAETNSDINSGTELLSLVAAIPTTGTEAPSVNNQWLVRVGPGRYDLGSSSLDLPDYTTIEGAGQDVTVITASGFADHTHGTVIMGNYGKLSRMTVNSSGESTYKTAVLIPSGTTQVGLDHAALLASDPTNTNGTTYAVYAGSDTYFWLEHCLLIANGAMSNYGVYAGSSTWITRLDSVEVNVYGSSSMSYGFYGSAASPRIKSSSFGVQDGGSVYGIRVTGGGSLELRTTQVWAPGETAVGVYLDGTYAALVGAQINAGSRGIQTVGSGLSATIDSSIIEGPGAWIYNGDGYTVLVGGSKLIGGCSNGFGGTVIAHSNYSNTTFFPDTCPAY